MSYQPRWYQAEAKQKLFEFLSLHPTTYDESGVLRPRNPLICHPTGTGKSTLIGDVAATMISTWPGMRVLMATHVKELIEQNADELRMMWPAVPLGVFSAGLKKKDRAALQMPIVYGGIKTLLNAVESLGVVHVVLVDEAHLIGPDEDTVYQRFITALRVRNPFLVVVGFTATAYRTALGSLTNNGVFTDIAHDITGYEAFNRLVWEGYLSPLFSKKTTAMIDTAEVGVQGGDFNQKQLAAVVENASLEQDMVREFLHYAQSRTAGIFFASSIKHAEEISAVFRWHGVDAPSVHSGLSDADNDERIRAFKAGNIRCLVNNNKLTTGFNYRPIDIIGAGRATLSASLWVQMLGRGTRPSPETYKRNCLVLDYARNTNRLGPINDPHIPKLKKGGIGEAPIWDCPACGHQNHARAARCEVCGEVHDMTSQLTNAASEKEVMRSAEPIIELFEVTRVLYDRHKKDGKPDSMRVSYVCGFTNTFHEWVCLDHPEPVGKRARDWWRRRGVEPPTAREGFSATDQALAGLTDKLKQPALLRVQTNCQYPEMVGVEF